MVLQSDSKRALVEMESKSMLVCWNEREVTIETEGGQSVVKYEYDFCRCAKNADRGELIDAIVRSRYSQSQMEAVVNNYLREDKTEEQVEAFNAMQEWRAQAKVIADGVVTAAASID